MKIICTLLLVFTAVPGFTKAKPSDGIVMTEASLTVAKNVCATKPDAEVWIFRGGWNLLTCEQLAPAFEADTENLFDSLIPQMQDAHDNQPKK